MKRSLYGERDYAFGQLMLTVRTNMGLTQARLAQRLGISRRAVSTWELGRGGLLMTGWHTDTINTVAFAPESASEVSSFDH